MKEYLHNIKNTQDLINLKNDKNPQTGFANDNHVSTINNQYIDPAIDYHPLTSISADTKTDDWFMKNAWGIVIKTSESGEDWELVGNRQLWEDFKAGKDTGHPIGRYWLNDDGTARKCDPNDSTKFLDGSPVPNDEGQIMVYLPDLYYRVYTMKSGHTVLWMSNKNIGGHKLDASMIGAFLCTNYNGKAYSRISDNIGSDWSTTTGYERTQAVGKYFNIMNYNQWRYIVMLHLSEFGTNDIQKTLGQGEKYKNNFIVGKTSKIGDKTHFFNNTIDEQNSDPRFLSTQNFLGIENLIYKYIYCSGIFFDYNTVYIYNDPTKLYKSTQKIINNNKLIYRTIQIPKDLVHNNTLYTTDIVCGPFFDILPTAQTEKFNKSKWKDASDYIYDNGIPRIFGSGNRNYCGLIYINLHDDYNDVIAIRNGYFGSIKFIK